MASELNYEELGFKAGIEIHQQLEGKKLFCDCPTTNSDRKSDLVFERQLRALAGETGEVDQAAQYEHEKKKTFLYSYDPKDCCLVEFDEEPPHDVNQEALQIALQVSKMLNADLVDEVQFMRKTVIDGSNVSGFQRTALVGMDGFIDTSKGKVRISSICLEEEAAKKVEDSKTYRKYRLDRLGIPLIEIATEPDIKDSEHAKETAEKIGMILRSTSKVKRGIGTIRQDVNVSINGSSRVEIKGFQDLKSIPLVVENEVKRQQKFLRKGEKNPSEVRKAEQDGTTSFLRPMPGAARMYPETDVRPIVVVLGDIEAPELLDEKAKRYEEEFGLSNDLAKKMVKSPMHKWFEEFISDYKETKPAFIAESLISIPKELNRKHKINPENLSKMDYRKIFDCLESGKIAKGSVMDVAADIAKGQFDIKKYQLISADDLEKEIKLIVEKNKGAPVGAIMGQIMAKFKGKVDGKQAMELIKKHI